MFDTTPLFDDPKPPADLREVSELGARPLPTGNTTREITDNCPLSAAPVLTPTGDTADRDNWPRLSPIGDTTEPGRGVGIAGLDDVRTGAREHYTPYLSPALPLVDEHVQVRLLPRLLPIAVDSRIYRVLVDSPQLHDCVSR